MANLFSLFLLVSVMRSEVGVGEKVFECGRKFWDTDNCGGEICRDLCVKNHGISEPWAVVWAECQGSRSCFCQYYCFLTGEKI
ncbi:hypothetical protein S83_065186 [Arachis hypogaea]